MPLTEKLVLCNRQNAFLKTKRFGGYFCIYSEPCSTNEENLLARTFHTNNMAKQPYVQKKATKPKRFQMLFALKSSNAIMLILQITLADPFFSQVGITVGLN